MIIDLHPNLGIFSSRTRRPVRRHQSVLRDFNLQGDIMFFLSGMMVSSIFVFS